MTNKDAWNHVGSPWSSSPIIYNSKEYLDNRRRLLFSDEEFEGFEAGINRFLGTAAISGSDSMEGLDLLELIEPDALFQLIFGSSFIQGIMLFLSILSYIRY